MGRVVVFGATGYTGNLAARACAERGLRPVLAGRNEAGLQAAAAELGGLEIAVADAGRPDTVRALVQAGDVLVTTVGPYLRYGEPALRAAAAAGAHYLDLTGETGFIRRVFDEYGTVAERAGVTMLPAFGHDWVPGNLAGALALRDAGDTARRLEIGYFDYLPGKAYTGLPPKMASSGTKATMASDANSTSYAFRGGRLVPERMARTVRRFVVDGRGMQAVSVGGTEQFALPRLFPALTEVEVYLGWFGQASRLAQAASAGQQLAERLPGVAALRARLFERALAVTGQGPAPGAFEHAECRTVAVCRDGAGRELSRVDLRGPADAYAASADLLAWGAEQLAAGRMLRAGACGPVDAFGLDALESGAARLGYHPL
ncbi:MAG TPA: saccharopine dehydrogenase NADP-binding domain-containing protein [Mycobacteriales bacterium]|nr:saccharopine dehydrogenase NADP-binding domain-containing protein [Mycobacteriales bacterium]